MAVPAVVREHYLKAIGALIERYKRELGASGIDYQLLTRTSRSSSRCWPICRREGERCEATRPWRAIADVIPVPAVPRRRARGGDADRAAPAQARAGSAREVLRGPLLQHAPVEHAQRRHLRELLLLALRVAALLLLALAFARPFLASNGVGQRRLGVTVVALDTSIEHVGARAVRAARAAGQAGDRSRPGGMVGVVTFADVPQVVGEASAIAPWPKRPSTQAPAGFGATSYRAALRAGRRPAARSAAARSWW